MPKREIRIKYKFLPEVKELIKSNTKLIIRVCNDIDTDIYGLCRMIDRDSQTLMHIHILSLLSEKLNIPINKLYKK